MVRITETIALHDEELRERFVRSPGPGGQNVNKVATAVQLRFDVSGSRSLGEDVKERLVRIAGKRMTAEGVLIISARRFRARKRNREDARTRLVEMIRKAASPPRSRRKTALTGESRELRLEIKRRRSEAKRSRRPVPPSED